MPGGVLDHPPFSMMKFAIVSTPSPVIKFGKTKGRFLHSECVRFHDPKDRLPEEPGRSC